jgi:hypothetical protein
MANYIRSYVRDSAYTYPFVDGEIVRNITGLTDINVETKKIYSDAPAHSSSMSPSIGRSPNYIYFFEYKGTGQILFYEYDIVNNFLRTHNSINTFAPFVVLEDRKIITGGNVFSYDYGSALYLINFEDDSETLLVEFEFETLDGVATWFWENVLFSTEYNDKKYIIFCGDIQYEYETDYQYGCAFYIYNYTDNIKIQKYSKNNDDLTKATSDPVGQAVLCTYIDGNLIYVPNLDGYMEDSYIPLHILNLNTLENSLYTYDYLFNQEIETYNILPDIYNNNLYLNVYLWDTDIVELLKFNLSDKNFSLVSSFENIGITFCVGNDKCFIYRRDTKYWYNINNLSVPVTNQVTTPSGGYSSVRNNLSFAYDDIGKRIWHFDRDLKKIVGVSTNGEYNRSISADITYYSTEFDLIRLFDLGDMFLVTIAYGDSPYPYEMYLIKSADWNPPVFPKNKFQAIWWNGGD